MKDASDKFKEARKTLLKTVPQCSEPELSAPERKGCGDFKNKRKNHRHLCLLIGGTEKESKTFHKFFTGGLLTSWL